MQIDSRRLLYLGELIKIGNASLDRLIQGRWSNFAGFMFTAKQFIRGEREAFRKPSSGEKH